MSEAGRRLGVRIKYLRWHARPYISQGEVAARAGISPAYLSMIERGTRSPTIETIAAIARALDVSLQSLFLDDAVLLYVPEFLRRSSESDRERLVAMLYSEDLKDSDVATLLEIAREFHRANAKPTR